MDQMTSGQKWRVGLGVAGAVIFVIAGVQMASIESQAGDTIFEAFFVGAGVFSFAMACLVLVLAIPESPKGRPSPEEGAQGSLPAKRWRPGTPYTGLENEVRMLADRADQSEDEDAMARLTRAAEKHGIDVDSYETWGDAAEAILKSRRGK